MYVFIDINIHYYSVECCAQLFAWLKIFKVEQVCDLSFKSEEIRDEEEAVRSCMCDRCAVNKILLDCSGGS